MNIEVFDRRFRSARPWMRWGVGVIGPDDRRYFLDRFNRMRRLLADATLHGNRSSAARRMSLSSGRRVLFLFMVVDDRPPVSSMPRRRR